MRGSIGHAGTSSSATSRNRRRGRCRGAAPRASAPARGRYWRGSRSRRTGGSDRHAGRESTADRPRSGCRRTRAHGRAGRECPRRSASRGQSRTVRR
ncbi:Hypothetical Protein RSKD131_4249 [Cereibacter sphaeroides KD131]|nr:Hypothetical Protein RSKD131_4249 [Cereibacter sphaeroides KD131]